MAKNSKAWRREEILPKPKMGELTLLAIESRCSFRHVGLVDQLMLEGARRIEPAVGNLWCKGRGACRDLQREAVETIMGV